MIPTGDLAAIVDDDLYVFGRWDDTLTVNGQQLPATVLEMAAREVAGAIDAAVVRIDGADGAICAMVEFEPGIQLNDAAVREAIARATGVMVAKIVLVGRGAIPRTSSGKVRRSEVRTQLEHSDLGTRDLGRGHLSG